MRFVVLTGGIFFILCIFIGVAFYVFDSSDGKEAYREQAYKQLLKVANSKGERVEDFLNNRKADAVFLAESKDARDVFDGESVKDASLVTERIKAVAKDTARDIEDYIGVHSDMALEDLQKSEEFGEIVVRDVGETGYTYIISMGEGIIYFHPDPEVKGKNYHELKGLFPFIWKFNDDIVTSSPCRDSYGFYDWEDADGNIRKKYTYHSCIDAVTSDGYSFFVGASSYIDEYGEVIQLVGHLDHELNVFQEEKGYSDLIFISPAGDVVWTTKRYDELGTSLVTGSYNDSLLSDVFNRVKRNVKVEVSDSKEYGEEGRLSLFVTAPAIGFSEVSGEDELLGILALRLDNEKIIDLVEDDIGLGGSGEVYIVNRDGNYVTPLKFEEVGEGDTYQSIDSSRIKSCFEDYNNYHLFLKGEETDSMVQFGEAENYAGVKSLGAHSYVLGSEWCIIVEMNEEEFLEATPQMMDIFILMIFVGLVCLVIVSLLIDSLFEISRGKGK